MASHFLAMLSRMKYINRWSLMRNSRMENLSEHSLDVAYYTHALLLIANRRFGKQLDVGQAVLGALYHDCGEILTGDLPTPIKYYNPDIKNAYRQIERVADEKLLSMLPADLRDDYHAAFSPDPALIPYIKAADKLSAYIKCLEEQKMGNSDFSRAAHTTLRALQEIELPEVQVFMEEFLPSFSLTLDEL